MATATIYNPDLSLEKLDRYVDGVLSGEIVAGKLVRMAVQRHVRDMENGGGRGLFFDREEAQFAITFIELLKHSKGDWAGQSFELEPWQVFIVASIFGWTRFDAKFRHGRRRFNSAFVSVGRKNGKSTLAAGIGHKLFVADGEAGAEIYSAACKRDQARIVHEEAKRMVKSSPSLRQIVRVLRDNLSIDASNSKYEPLGADADTTDGLNISGAIIDEVHAHKTRELWDVLETSTAARRNPLMLAITTAGPAGESESIYTELKGHSIKVLEAAQAGEVLDDSWFTFIATLDDDDDWADEAVWCLASDTKLYARIDKGITVCTIQAIARTLLLSGIELWDGHKWVKVLGISKAPEGDPKLRIRLRSGQRISCTTHHAWPTQRGKLRADELLVGDVIKLTTLPEPETIEPCHIPEGIGWLIGLYLAEGSKTAELQKNRTRKKLQFSGHANELVSWVQRIKPLAEAYHGSCHGHKYGSKSTLIVESRILGEIIDLYVGGKDAHSKYLKPRMWRRRNPFLRQVAEGYLEGDGSYDESNNRYRLGFCRNDALADSLRTLAARLGAQCRLHTGFVSNQTGKRFPSYSGEWRWNVSNHHSCKSNGEIVAIESSSGTEFWHVGVDNDSGLFALASGVVTHNSKANPNLGVCVDIEDLRRKALKAKANPSAVSNFRRRHMNQDTASLEPWVTMEKWNACGQVERNAERTPQEMAESFRDRHCTVGGDLSSVSDLTALVFAFVDDEGAVDVVPFCWCPRQNALGRTRDKRVPYVSWAERGQLYLTEGDSVDYDSLRDLLRRARDDWKWQIDRIFFDPNNARYLITKLIEEDGFNESQIVEHLQTTGHMNDPIAVTEKLILDETLRHGGHEPLRWCVSNVRVYQDSGGRRRFDKKKSSEKIDLAVALVMAAGQALIARGETRSPYETRGFLTT